MDFLCPSCQKPLTVADQYAGTQIKCPFCQNTFTAPALPPKPVAVPPPAPPRVETYGVQEPVVAPPPAGPASPPPPTAVTAAPPLNKITLTGPAMQPPLPPLGGHRVGFTIPLSPTVVPWIAPAALFLVFLLQIFFSWIGYYAAGYSGVWQGPWFAAFGWYNIDSVWQKVSGFNEAQTPHWSPLLILYLLLFMPTLLLSILAAALSVLPIKLPSGVKQLERWRWAVVAGLALLVFLILSLQLLTGFSLETQARSAIAKRFEEDRKSATTPEENEKVDMKMGMAMNELGLRRTTYLRLAFFLHLLAVIAAALSFWLDYRTTAQPIPRLEVHW